MKTLTDRQKANRVVKLTGLFFVLLAGLNYFQLGFSWAIASGTMTAGLFMLLFTPERIDDERVREWKFKAIAWGFAGGLLGVVLYDMMVMSLQITVWPVLSAYDSLLIVTALALGLFHFLRWRDGRRAGSK
jgi:hypothetical protein